MNSVSGCGNLVRDAELKALPTGTKVLNFTVAVNESRRRGDEWEDYPNYFDCVVYGARAEPLSRYLHKGTKVAVDGRLHQDRWEKDGHRRDRIEIVVDDLEFMSRNTDTSDESPKASVPAAPPKADEYDEEIPF